MSKTILGRLRTFTVLSGGMRLDQYLGDCADIKSRSEARSLIVSGHVKLKGRKCLKPSASVQAGDTITVQLPSPPPVESSVASTLPLAILYEDADCFVIDKTAGISVHPGHGISPDEVTILSALRPLFEQRNLPFHPSSVLAHRLDKDTTGCLLIAKTPAAHTALQRQFEERTVRKTYLALVNGLPSPAAAVIDAPIGRHKHDRTKMSVLDASSKLRTATTTYRTLAQSDAVDRDKQAALLACELHTGRTHQLRVHLSTIGHPILGDQTYGSSTSKKLASVIGIGKICLHAWRFTFTSFAGKQVQVESPVPQEFKLALERCGIRWKSTRK